MEQDHTLEYFRENWLPALFDRSSFVSLDDSRAKDLYASAREQLRGMYAARDFWELEPERQRAIDEVLHSAARTLA